MITPTPKVNETIYLWFYSLKSRGLLASRPIIKENTEILSKKFSDENKGFRASEGWLYRWKTFYSIRRLNLNDEKLSVDEVEVALYRDEFAEIFDHDYCMDQIFNLAETGLNYKILTRKTLATKTNRGAWNKEVQETRGYSDMHLEHFSWPY